MGDPRPFTALLIDRAAAIERIQLDPCCWVEVTSGLVTDPAAALEDLMGTTSWQQGEVLRYDRYIPERRLAAWLQVADRPLLRQLELHLQARYRQPLTGAGAVLYRDGQDFQGLHGDRELRWLSDTLVAIVVLGQRRPFLLRRRGLNPDGTVAERVVHPGQGDLLVMGGTCQRHWLHGVPAVDGHEAGFRRPHDLRQQLPWDHGHATAERSHSVPAAPADPVLPRISLTWRWTSRQGPPDTNPSYFDGRQFSDVPRRRGHRTRPV